MTKRLMAGLIIAGLIFGLGSAGEAFDQIATWQLVNPKINLLPFADKKRVYELAVDLVEIKELENAGIGNIRDTGAAFVVEITDSLLSHTVKNEWIIRKDGAVMPVYMETVADTVSKPLLIYPNQAAAIVEDWLFNTGQDDKVAGNVVTTATAYIVDIHYGGDEARLSNQVVVRKDGYLLPIGNGIPSDPSIKLYALDYFPSFEFMPDIHFEPDWGWGYNPEHGWGWSWGDQDNWEPPQDSSNHEDKCRTDTERDLECTNTCNLECGLEPDAETKCFERCYLFCCTAM